MRRLLGLGLLALWLLFGHLALPADVFALEPADSAKAGVGHEAKAAPVHGEKAEGAHAGKPEAERGAPMDFVGDLAIWSLVTFLVYLVVLKKAAWGPLIQGLDQREAKMKQQIAGAESARVKAEAMLADHAKKLDKVQDEVKEILAEARRDAEHTKQEIVALANREAEATRRRAVEDIEHARDLAMKELFDFLNDKVIGATGIVLGRALSEDDQKRLVQDALNQMGSKT